MATSRLSKLGLAFFAMLSVSLVGFSMSKQDVEAKYKNKFLVVMREGLPLAICADKPGAKPFFPVRITASGIDTSRHGFLENMPEGRYDVCGPTPEPLHKGEVLKTSHVPIHGKWVGLIVDSLSAHAITRGIGAYQHEAHEYHSGTLMFSLEDGYDQAVALIDQWVKPFDTQEEAAKFGNTASGVFVKEVKLGMTFAEVESVMGVPEAKVDLGEKVLYKYKDMTVEFHGGKVTDVR